MKPSTLINCSKYIFFWFVSMIIGYPWFIITKHVFFSFFLSNCKVKLPHMIHTHIHTQTMNIESKANCYSVIIWWSVYVWGLWYDVVLCSGEKERKKGKRIRWLSLNTIDNRYEYISATPQNNIELITMKFTHFFFSFVWCWFFFCFSLALSCYTSYLFIRLMIIDWVIGSLIFLLLLLFFCL